MYRGRYYAFAPVFIARGGEGRNDGGGSKKKWRWISIYKEVDTDEKVFRQKVASTKCWFLL